jgi:hypothetical protein
MRVEESRWSVLTGKRRLAEEHINALELPVHPL